MADPDFIEVRSIDRWYLLKGQYAENGFELRQVADIDIEWNNKDQALLKII